MTCCSGVSRSSGTPDAVVDQYVRLQLADHGDQLLRRARTRPCAPGSNAGTRAAVVPEDVDLAVVGHQLLDLRVGLLDHRPGALGVALGIAVAGESPVQERVVEPDLQPGLAGGLDVLGHEVALGGGLDAGEVAHLAVEQAEAVVVAGGQHHVLRARPPWRAPAQASASNLLRVELIGQLGVFLVGDVLHEHHPLAPRRDRVQPPVDEHPEPGLVEPLHSLFVSQLFHACRDLPIISCHLRAPR